MSNERPWRTGYAPLNTTPEDRRCADTCLGAIEVKLYDAIFFAEQAGRRMADDDTRLASIDELLGALGDCRKLAAGLRNAP